MCLYDVIFYNNSGPYISAIFVLPEYFSTKHECYFWRT